VESGLSSCASTSFDGKQFSPFRAIKVIFLKNCPVEWANPLFRRKRRKKVLVRLFEGYVEPVPFRNCRLILEVDVNLARLDLGLAE
jgi:hypothetical protein